MSPCRDEEMTGVRVAGSPSQHHLAMEMDRNASPTIVTTGDDHEALAGFAIHDVMRH